jgi:hypothetical protein
VNIHIINRISLLLCNSIIFLLFPVLIAAPVSAENEMLTGTVLSADHDRETFVIRTDNGDEVEVDTAFSQLPRRITAGKKLRIWGEYTPDNDVFSATDIRGPGRKHYHDQTGVRARIGRRTHCRKFPDGRASKNNSNGHNR